MTRREITSDQHDLGQGIQVVSGICLTKAQKKTRRVPSFVGPVGFEPTTPGL